MSFLKPQEVIASIDLLPGQVLADFGCGGGYFALAAAQSVGTSGKVYAVDVQDSKVAATVSQGKQLNLHNIVGVQADLTRPLSAIPQASCDWVLMANIIHEIPERQQMFESVFTVLKPGGKVLAIEWQKRATPLGPVLAKRLAPDQLVSELSQVGLRKIDEISVDSYHYAIIFERV